MRGKLLNTLTLRYLGAFGGQADRTGVSCAQLVQSCRVRFKMGASFRLPLSNCTGCGRDARDPSEAPPNLAHTRHVLPLDLILRSSSSAA